MNPDRAGLWGWLSAGQLLANIHSWFTAVGAAKICPTRRYGQYRQLTGKKKFMEDSAHLP
jgi:hypothetical protein